MTVQPERFFPAWTLGDRIRKARTTARMSQEEFADAIGAKEGSVAAWETDRAKPRDVVAVAKRIAMLTGIPEVWVLGLDDGPPEGGPPGGGVRPKGFEPLTFWEGHDGDVISVDFRQAS